MGCSSLQRSVASGQRVFEVLDAKSPVEETPAAKVMGRSQHGRVQFNDVSFSYDEHTPALNHVNIDASPGQVTAILCAPGSGKSTIVNLLPRFYDVTEGHIDIDNNSKNIPRIESYTEENNNGKNIEIKVMRRTSKNV